MAGPAHGEVWLCVLASPAPEPALTLSRSYKDKKFGGTCWKFNETKESFEDLGCNNKARPRDRDRSGKRREKRTIGLSK